MELYKPAERLVTPLKVPMDRLLCGPGPSNCHPRVLKASSLPLLGHLHPEFLSVMADITAGLQYVFQTSNPLTIAVSGTGHAGMEAAMVNIVEPGDSVLVLQNGIWGDRAREVASRCGMLLVEGVFLKRLWISFVFRRRGVHFKQPTR